MIFSKTNSGGLVRIAACVFFLLGFGMIWAWAKKQQMDLSYTIEDLHKVISDNEKRQEDLQSQIEELTVRESLQRRLQRSVTDLQNIAPSQVITIDADGIAMIHTAPEPVPEETPTPTPTRKPR
jgi:hypothetical protein